MSDRVGPDPGFAVLRKSADFCENQYLRQLIIRESQYPESKIYNELAIVDKELFDSIEDGDIGFITKNGSVRVVLSKNANHNTLLVTERCDNACLFCSQPPKDVQDDWLLVQSAMAIAAFQSTETIGISGGEPLLYKETFIRFLDFLCKHASTTPLHILSNGRAFSDPAFAKAIADRCQTLNLTFGIPLYSSVEEMHDHLVGADGAFRETLLGLINAGNSGVPIELRIIPTSMNFKVLPNLINLIARCFSNIAQISIMNLEPAGWARRNWKELYITPLHYHHYLVEAIQQAKRADLQVKLFNYPLCHLPEELQGYSVQSISDWKNYYPEVCSSCKLKFKCAGFFTSSTGKFHDQARAIV
ncbi:His-Xaa-Ser system radical SAM maturase HxsC [Gilvimarinus japonicus]|uniref:His-Xaa-Ser system radical SAM maturase HxsC n=1 Tax=Gilvimarinus japonicus TaxID=1796469 RepID=A0ABV7HN98_9GAMM